MNDDKKSFQEIKTTILEKVQDLSKRIKTTENSSELQHLLMETGELWATNQIPRQIFCRILDEQIQTINPRMKTQPSRGFPTWIEVHQTDPEVYLHKKSNQEHIAPSLYLTLDATQKIFTPAEPSPFYQNEFNRFAQHYDFLKNQLQNLKNRQMDYHLIRRNAVEILKKAQYENRISLSQRIKNRINLCFSKEMQSELIQTHEEYLAELEKNIQELQEAVYRSQDKNPKEDYQLWMNDRQKLIDFLVQHGFHETQTIKIDEW